ncbi:glycosyltransferase [Bacillus paranthracis]|uniref:glycosyltransferase n=1 Tax=Bacillus paranthracis TaxID=2026186 RepID=UPI000D6B627B|nr:glycosyltransferase [Bacillus paranthracis]PWN72693.1 glycosyl transferase [Bacillus cereus]MCX3321203.1 glycosyltransferase [Bacillus paranthracis]MEC4620511.1 glycosyltransferase [Bacillus paranthracis]PWN78640.1 glycosyl transferase [Bacillus cereus]UHJ50791.1 glycosyltransferase [Bacillus paranthracis]
MGNKRVAFFLSSLDGGGVERMTLNLSQELSDRGYDVDLIVCNLKGGYVKEIPSSVNVYNLDVNKGILSIFKLKKYLKSRKPEVFISAKDYLNIIAIIAKLLSRIKTNLIVSTRVNISTQLSHGFTWKLKIISSLIKYFYPYANKVVAVSEGVKADLMKLTKLNSKDINVIYNPVITKGLEEKLAEEIYHPWLESTNIPVIVTVARLHPQKDLQTLLKAMAIIKKTKEVRLIVVGDGPERNKLDNFISELKLENSVSLVGFKANPYPYLKKSSLFVLSSLYEGFGNVLVEALFAGIPIVSTDCPSGPAEILNNGEFGILVPVGNADELAKAIIKKLEQEKNIESLQARANEFTVQRALEKYISLF